MAILDSSHAEIVLISALQALEYSFASSNWNAHMGQGFAFVTAELYTALTLECYAADDVELGSQGSLSKCSLANIWPVLVKDKRGHSIKKAGTFD